MRDSTARGAGSPARADNGSRRLRRLRRRVERQLRKLLGSDWRVYGFLVLVVVAALVFAALRLGGGRGDDEEAAPQVDGSAGPAVSVPPEPLGSTTTTWQPPVVEGVQRTAFVAQLEDLGFACEDLMVDTPNPDAVARLQCLRGASQVAVTGRDDEGLTVVVAIVTPEDAGTLLPAVAERAFPPATGPEVRAWVEANLPLVVSGGSAATFDGVPISLGLGGMDDTSTVLLIGQPFTPA